MPVPLDTAAALEVAVHFRGDHRGEEDIAGRYLISIGTAIRCLLDRGFDSAKLMTWQHS